MKALRAWLNAQPNHRYSVLVFLLAIVVMFARLHGVL